MRSKCKGLAEDWICAIMQNFPKREGGMVELTISNLLVSQFGSTSGASFEVKNLPD